MKENTNRWQHHTVLFSTVLKPPSEDLGSFSPRSKAVKTFVASENIPRSVRTRTCEKMPKTTFLPKSLTSESKISDLWWAIAGRRQSSPKTSDFFSKTTRRFPNIKIHWTAVSPHFKSYLLKFPITKFRAIFLVVRKQQGKIDSLLMDLGMATLKKCLTFRILTSTDRWRSRDTCVEKYRHRVISGRTW